MIRFHWFIIPIASLLIVLLIIVLYIHFFTKPSVIEETIIPSSIREVVASSRNILELSIKDFSNGSRIPAKYTCDSEDISPEIIVKKIPNGTVSIVLIMYDPDAPSGVFYHWIIYNITVTGSEVKIPEGIKSESTIGIQLRNDFGKIGYNGPCPPSGYGIHRYVFIAIGLNKFITSRVNSLSELLNECKGYVTSFGIYIGTYSR